MSEKVQGSRRNKSETDALNLKINQLSEENKRLVNKVSELEEEIERYHSEVLTEELKKLSSINFSKDVAPSGR